MKKSIVATGRRRLQQGRRDRLEFYLDDSCDRLKTCRDGYFLMETIKRQRGSGFGTIKRGIQGHWSSLVGPCLSLIYQCRQLVRSLGRKLTSDSVTTVIAIWKQALTSFTPNTSRHAGHTFPTPMLKDFIQSLSFKILTRFLQRAGCSTLPCEIVVKMDGTYLW